MNKQPSMATCLVCGKGPTIDAHLLPRAIVHDLRGNLPNALVGSSNEAGFVHTQAGLSDKGILCGDCEEKLGPPDTYAVGFVREYPSNRRELDGRIIVPQVNVDLLVRFVLSVLWRCSVSSQMPEFNVGPYETKFRDIVFYGHECSPEPATCVFQNVSPAAVPMAFVQYPMRVPNRDGTRFWSFRIFELTFRVRPPRRTPPALTGVPVNGKDPIEIGLIVWERSDEFRPVSPTLQQMGLSRRPRR
jgi:hypothetical protein